MAFMWKRGGFLSAVHVYVYIIMYESVCVRTFVYFDTNNGIC